MLVMHADCDLLWDFKYRSSRTIEEPLNSGDRSLVPEVLLCDAYEESQIRQTISGSDIFRRIRQNQDERYQCLQKATVGSNSGVTVPELYLDFKKMYMEPTEALYSALGAGSVSRVGIIPPIYIHDLMHRLFGFLSRVGVPE
jgi:hypothetical protein